MAVCSLLQRPEVRFVTLIGPGGVGKTRLGWAVAGELLEHFVHGVCFVSLAPVSDPSLVIATIAQTLGLWEAGDRPLLEQVRAYLRDQHLLLLLDNFEQVVAAAPQLADLLAFCPQLHVLVTSRAALRIQGEYEFMVSPLAVPDLKQLPMNEELAQIATVSLFLQRAQAIRSDFQLTAANAHTIAAICARLEGLPLAIELAAAHIKLLPPQALLKRLKDRLQVLTGGKQDLPARQQTLHNTLQWSYDLLTPQEQRLFRLLSIFVGGCSLQAAEAVAQTVGSAALADTTGSNQAMEVLDGMVSLLDKSLLQQTEVEAEEPRLLMLETIREYGLACLQEQGELEVMRQAHAAYYLRLAEEAALYQFSAEAGSWFEILEREQENLRATLQWALEDQSEEAENGIETAARLGWALWRFWSVRGRLHEGRTFLERVLEASEKSEASVRAKALSATALLASYQGDYVRAEQLCGEALTLFQQLADQKGIVHVLAVQIGVALHRRQSRHILALAEESLALLRRDGDPWWTAYFLIVLARAASFQHEYARASQLFEESLTLLRTLGYPGDVAWPLLYLAHDLIIQGEHTRARPLLEEGLTLCRKADSKGGLAYALSLLGQVAFEQGDVAGASDHFTESLRLNQEVGHRQSISRSFFFLASVMALQTAGYDGALWFTETNTSRIAAIDTNGNFLYEFQATPDSSPRGITTGTDGSIWFTEDTGNAIGHLNGSQITEYAVPTADSGPAAIITGPDGNLWFTEADAGQVQPLNTSGQFLRTYSVNGSPVGITVGVDGAFWFAEQSGYIGRLTLSGNLTQYAVPNGATSQPTNIAVGSDHNLWFTEFRASQVGVARTQVKQLKQFAIKTANSVPIGITAGPDGKLWFAESKGNKIGRITTTGTLTQYNIPTANSGTWYITTGPDKALWFTETNANQLGRITPAGQVTEYTFPNPQADPMRSRVARMASSGSPS